MIGACRKKWIVKIQDDGSVAEYGFYLKDDDEWLAEEVLAFTLADRQDLEFKRMVDPAIAVATSAAAATAAAASSASSAAPLSAGASVAPPAPLTEKAKKARREKIEKEVALFLQRRPPNSAPSTLRPDANKHKPIHCNLNYDVIDFCLGFLEKHNVLELEGIYRISGNSDTVRHVWAAFCLGHFDYLDWQDTAGEIAHVVTGACKLYLRELEVPLLPWDTHQKFLACETITDPAVKLATVKELVGNLNAVSQHTLRRLMYHLWDVAGFEKVNRMSPNNLAIVFGPTIMRPEVQDLAEMLSNATKVDLCTYMILQREQLFALDTLKPMTERTLGPMPVLEEGSAKSSNSAGGSGGSGSGSSKVSLRKGKSQKDIDDKIMSPPENKPVAATLRDPKKSMIGSALSGATTRKSQNPRGYSDALQAMLADLLPEVVAGCMVFTRQMEVDPKGEATKENKREKKKYFFLTQVLAYAAFRKHLKSLPPDQLIDMIQNLAKHVTTQPATNVSSRAAKTIVVGQQPAGAHAASSAAQVASASAPAVGSTTATVTSTSALAATAAVAAPVMAAHVSAVPSAVGSSSVGVDSEAPPPRPTRAPPSIVLVPEDEDGSVEDATGGDHSQVDDDGGSGTPVVARSRSQSFVDLTVVDDEEEPDFVIVDVHTPEVAGGATPVPVSGSPEKAEEIVVVEEEKLQEVEEKLEEENFVVIESSANPEPVILKKASEDPAQDHGNDETAKKTEDDVKKVGISTIEPDAVKEEMAVKEAAHTEEKAVNASDEIAKVNEPVHEETVAKIETANEESTSKEPVLEETVAKVEAANEESTSKEPVLEETKVEAANEESTSKEHVSDEHANEKEVKKKESCFLVLNSFFFFFFFFSSSSLSLFLLLAFIRASEG